MFLFSLLQCVLSLFLLNEHDDDDDDDDNDGRKLQLFPTPLAFNAPVGDDDPLGRPS